MIFFPCCLEPPAVYPIPQIFSGCDLYQEEHHSSVGVIPDQKGIQQYRPLNWGYLGLHISQKVPNSAYAYEQGYSGHGVP